MKPKKSFKPHFILNPASSAGRTGKSQRVLLELLQRGFPQGFTLDITSEPGQATMMTRQALKNGTDLVVAIGGDGTAHEVVNGFFEKGKSVRRAARLGFLCSGTAKDVARNIGLPERLSDQISAIGQSNNLIDLGKVSYFDSTGSKQERYFINDCQSGMAAKVVQRVTPKMKRLGGFLAFGAATTLTAVSYRAHEITVDIDGSESVSGKFLGVIAANGRYSGGGMDVAPRSRINDGRLDILVIRDQSLGTRLWNFPRIYSGTHIDLPWILHRYAKRIKISSPERVGLVADGEFLGFLPCEIKIVPKALRTG